MEKDLEILEKIFKEYGYAGSYIALLMDHILKGMKEKELSSITPNLLYSTLMFEVGRKRAQEISEFFEEYKKLGYYKTPLEKYLDKSPWAKLK